MTELEDRSIVSDSTGADLRPEDLRLRDVIKLFDGAFGYAIVYRIDTEKSPAEIHLRRVYATTSETAYCGGRVIPYIGVEDIITWIGENRRFYLEERPRRAQ